MTFNTHHHLPSELPELSRFRPPPTLTRRHIARAHTCVRGQNDTHTRLQAACAMPDALPCMLTSLRAQACSRASLSLRKMEGRVSCFTATEARRRVPACLAVGFDASRSRALVRAPRMTDFGIEMSSGSSSITADTHRGCTGLSQSLGVGSYVSPIRGIGLWCSPDRRVQELGVWRARKCV